MKIIDLERFVSRSMVTVQSQIVINGKDKEGNFVMEGNSGLSWKKGRKHIMDHVIWKIENFFYYRRCNTDGNIKKYKNTLHVELEHYFILLH